MDEQQDQSLGAYCENEHCSLECDEKVATRPNFLVELATWIRTAAFLSRLCDTTRLIDARRVHVLKNCVVSHAPCTAATAAERAGAEQLT